ncbi:hypothetical protein DEI90_14825, partial [Curtobacterium sp. MCBD17_031]
MDKPLRAPRIALVRLALLGTVVAAAFVVLGLLLGAKPASAAETTPGTTSSHSLLGAVGNTVSGVVDGVGTAVQPVTRPAAPAPAPAAPAPAAPAPRPAAPAP